MISWPLQPTEIRFNLHAIVWPDKSGPPSTSVLVDRPRAPPCHADQRHSALDDRFKLTRCHTTLTCAKTCPKGLNPAKAIAEVKKLVAGG